MKKKPLAVGEAAAPYNAKPAVKGKGARQEEKTGVRYMDDATFRKSADKIFKVHNELFRKLAQ